MSSSCGEGRGRRRRGERERERQRNPKEVMAGHVGGQREHMKKANQPSAQHAWGADWCSPALDVCLARRRVDKLCVELRFILIVADVLAPLGAFFEADTVEAELKEIVPIRRVVAVEAACESEEEIVLEARVDNHLLAVEIVRARASGSCAFSKS